MSDDKDPPVDELAKASVEQQKPTIEDADDDDVSAAAAATQQQNDAGSSSGAAGGPIVSLQDLLAEQEELEKDYAAVLGGSDEKCCTYSKVTCDAPACVRVCACLFACVCDNDKCKNQYRHDCSTQNQFSLLPTKKKNRVTLNDKHCTPV